MERGDGILSGPIDLDGRRRVAATYPPRAVAPGTTIVERATKARLVVVSVNGTQVVALDAVGTKRLFRNHPGTFEVDGVAATLVAARTDTAPAADRRTASGSVAAPTAERARVARASRILVEGVHDAELLERVWGDDLRHEGVVVERLDGMDHLDAALRELGPGPGRRIGVLLDHLVDGSKESRAAAAVTAGHEHVLVVGHPYVDVWQAVRPASVGIEAWPRVAPGTPWKDGVCRALGRPDPRAFWREVLAAVDSWDDLETPLVNAVERLIDFVTTDDV